MQQGLYFFLCRFPFYIMHAVSNHSLLNMHSNSSSVSLTQYFFPFYQRKGVWSPNLTPGHAGREVGSQVNVSSPEETQASTHGERDRGDHDGLWVGENLQGNEPQLKLADTIIKVMMHSLLLTCLEFCLIPDHNSLQLPKVSLQHQPVERQDLMQEIFIVICSPKKHCKYFLTAKMSWDSIRCLNTCPSTSSSAEPMDLS